MESRLQAAGADAHTMIIEVLNALERADAAPAEAGTPCGAEIRQGRKYGVPPSGGGPHAHTMIIEELKAQESGEGKQAEAGTPCGAEIQQGRNYGVPPSGGGGGRTHDDYRSSQRARKS